MLLLCRLFGTVDDKEQDITGHDQVKSEDEGSNYNDKGTISSDGVNRRTG